MLLLTWQHVHLEQKTVYLPKTKNGHPRTVPLSPTARALLGLLSPGSPAERVVPIELSNLNRQFRLAKASVDLRHIRFHDARREALTMMAPKVSVMELAKISGHRNLDILMNTYYSPDITDLANKLG